MNIKNHRFKAKNNVSRSIISAILRRLKAASGIRIDRLQVFLISQSKQKLKTILLQRLVLRQGPQMKFNLTNFSPYKHYSWPNFLLLKYYMTLDSLKTGNRRGRNKLLQLTLKWCTDDDCILKWAKPRDA